MNLTTVRAKKRGGAHRLKNKEEVIIHGDEEYEKLKIQPRNNNEYHTLHSYVVNFLELFSFPPMRSFPPDEWSQYMTIELLDETTSKEEAVQLLFQLGFWATLDEESIIIDLADVDLKLLMDVLPYELISFKTTPERFQETEVVTSKHFVIEYPTSPPLSEKIYKEKKTRKPKTSNGHEVPFHLNGNGVPKTVEEKPTKREKTILPLEQHHEFPSFKGSGGNSIPTFLKLGLGGDQDVSSLVPRNSFSALDLNNEVARNVFQSPFGIEHRLEHVTTIEGVSYWNDSKATNINSTWFALESTPGPIILICGGQDEGNDYTELLPLVAEKVRGIICLAKDASASKIRNTFAKIVPLFFETESMEQAVRQAYVWSKKGDSVLLSPACASSDLFENYEDRGQQFKKAVRAF